MRETSTLPKGWSVTHARTGRGSVYTRVEFADGRGINFSGRLTITRAVDAAAKQLRDWDALGMRDAGLAAFASLSQSSPDGERGANP
jgi:hypothetical protein